MSMPGADELFRATAKQPGKKNEPQLEKEPAPEPSGRVKHDEKMTVYLTSDELLAIEQARLELRSELGKKIDRGRFVRAALASALADLATRGPQSDVARRLGES